MIIETLVVGMIQANCYIIADPATKKAVVIDPGGDAPVIAKKLEDMGVNPVAIILTHGHFDHVEGSGELKKLTGVPVYAHKGDSELIGRAEKQGAIFGIEVSPVPPPDKFLEDGDTFDFGELTIKVLHTPGHSNGSISLLVGKDVFVGDLLFAGSIGRTDLQKDANGNMNDDIQARNYDTLIDAVKTKIFTLPEEVVVFPGHGPKTSVGHEKRMNPFFR